MTIHNTRLMDIYTDYLLSSFSTTTATGLSRPLPEVSHDAATHFPGQNALGNRELWAIVKPIVRSIKHKIEHKNAVLAIDDIVQEKPYTDQSQLIIWHDDHNLAR